MNRLLLVMLTFLFLASLSLSGWANPPDYLTNDYEMQVHSVQGEVFFEVTMADAWVWDMYRPARFVKQVRVLTFKDVNIEELNKSDLEMPGG